MKQEAKKEEILFITSTRIGDAVLSCGLLAHLLEIYPQAHFTIVCGELPAPLFRHVPRLKALIPLVKKSFNRHWLELWPQLATTRWRHVVDLRNSVLSRLLLAQQRHSLGGEKPDMHKVEAHSALLNIAPPVAPRLWHGEAERLAALQLLPPTRPVLILAPAANWAGKVWPAQNFIHLAERLLQEAPALKSARIAVFAAAHERAMAEPVMAGLAKHLPLDCIGHFDLAQVAAHLARASLFIGNDSGLTHIAAAAGVPTLGVFGPSDDRRYRPWGARAGFVRADAPYEVLLKLGEKTWVGQKIIAGQALPDMFPNLTVDRAAAAASALLAACSSEGAIS